MRRAAIAAAVLLLVACAHDGRTLRPPPVGATAPSLVTTLPPNQATAAAPIALSSSAFAVGGPIPIEHTCDGAGVSPPLAWGAVPESTVELAITVIDSDANGFVHWVVTRLAPNVQALAVGIVPDDAIQAKNDASTTGWTGPCPPKGSPPHHYVFTLYALTSPSGVTADMSAKDAVTAIANVPGLTATLTGSYQRA